MVREKLLGATSTQVDSNPTDKTLPRRKMKVVVLSDSHIDSIDLLPRRTVDELSGADLIVHAGDYTGTTLLEELRRLGTFKGVHGNMDPPEIRRELAALETFVVGGFTIGINHPSEGGSPFGVERRVSAKFQDVDAIIFGHTHRAKNEYRDGVLHFNPGSATGTFPASKKTFGVITVGENLKGEIRRA
jgi:putative phosphoesterase